MTNSNINDFLIKLIQISCNPLISKNLLLKVKYGRGLLGTFNFSDKNYGCPNCLLMNEDYNFKNI